MVAVTTMNIADVSRSHFSEPQSARPVRTTIWRSDQDAPAPLILLSHGTGGSVASFDWLATALVADGFTVAGVDHHGNTSVEPYAALGFARMWERPRDFTVVLDALAEDPGIDMGRIGAVGFSLGGYTVGALLGARVSPERLRALIDEPDRLPVPEYPDLVPELRSMLSPAGLASLLADSSADVSDDRVRCGFQLAPLGAIVDPTSLSAVRRPLRVLWAGADHNAPAESNAAVYLQASVASGRSLGDAVGHYDVLADQHLQKAVTAEAVGFFQETFPRAV